MVLDKKNDFPVQPTASASDLIPEVDKVPQRPTDTGDIKPARARKSPKPLVEGINTPVGGEPAPVSLAPAPIQPEPVPAGAMQGQSIVVPPKITLTNSEKQLIEEPASPSFTGVPAAKPKIFPTPSTSQKISLPTKSSSVRKIGWSLLISLLAVCLVFGLLLWYNNKSGGNAGQNFSLFPQRPNVPVNQAPQNPVAATPSPVTVPAATSTPVVVPTSTPVANLTQVKISNTPTGYLNVRNAPSTSGKLLTKVHPGEIYTYTQTKNGWYYITLSDGSQGWVTGQYVQVVK